MKNRNENGQEIRKACEAILRVIRPGDVINQYGDFQWWQVWLVIGSRAIQWYQRWLFGRHSEWRDDHTMLYFDDKNILSVELPVSSMKPLSACCLTNISIYRLSGITLAPSHIETMREASEKLLYRKYDIGQLLDIAVNGLLGYVHERRLKFFDLGKKRKVCSVGVRVVFEYLHNRKLKSAQSRPGKWLFYSLNPDKWPPAFVKHYRGTDVEATSPAHFANSDYFRREFRLIARFEKGEMLS